MSDEMTDAYTAWADGRDRWELPGDDAFRAGWNARGLVMGQDGHGPREWRVASFPAGGGPVIGEYHASESEAVEAAHIAASPGWITRVQYWDGADAWVDTQTFEGVWHGGPKGMMPDKCEACRGGDHSYHWESMGRLCIDCACEVRPEPEEIDG